LRKGSFAFLLLENANKLCGNPHILLLFPRAGSAHLASLKIGEGVMTNNNNKILFTALGFLAVIMNEVPQNKRALRATALARLIEEFCATALPEAVANNCLEASRWAETENLIELYIAELRDTGSARLNYDRPTLLNMYEQLLFQKMLHEQKEFIASGHDDVIANRILQLAEEKIQREASQ
jgi:hypothetical protein